MKKRGPPQRPETPLLSINRPTKDGGKQKKRMRLQEKKSSAAAASGSDQFSALNKLPNITSVSPKKYLGSRIPGASIKVKDCRGVADMSVQPVQPVTSQKLKGKVCNIASSNTTIILIIPFEQVKEGSELEVRTL